MHITNTKRIGKKQLFHCAHFGRNVFFLWLVSLMKMSCFVLRRDDASSQKSRWEKQAWTE